MVPDDKGTTSERVPGHRRFLVIGGLGHKRSQNDEELMSERVPDLTGSLVIVGPRMMRVSGQKESQVIEHTRTIRVPGLRRSQMFL